MDLTHLPVSIVLATRNGAAFLPNQLRSLLAQDYKLWHLILSDDGSTDDTVAIAQDLIEDVRLQVLNGPQLGLALNFWHALQHVPDGHFAAFCDQDDVWHSDKLSRALTHLADSNGSALYSSGRYVSDHALRIRSLQTRKSVGSLASLLFRNTVAGHTCVLNPKAVHILKHNPPPRTVAFHDWWAALVLKRSGAKFIHDTEPTLIYRQHASNVIGAHGGRITAMLNGTYFRWITANMIALRSVNGQNSEDASCLPPNAGWTKPRA